MNFFKYLKDQWTLILGWLFFIALTIFVMWLAPNIKVDLSTIAYLALIEGVFLIFYLLGGYLSKRRWWGKLADIQKTSPLQNYLSGGRTEEEKLVEEYINQLIREHQEVMQSAISNQQDQKDYIDSWVHEIKVPLSASKLLVRSIEFDIDDQKYTLLENELSKIDEYVCKTRQFLAGLPHPRIWTKRNHSACDTQSGKLFYPKKYSLRDCW